MIGVTGTGFDQLNAPYDAKQIGDYTGLTNPFESDFQQEGGDGDVGR